MIYLIIICFFLWMFMLWLTYSKQLNSAKHLITLIDEKLHVRDTPISRLIKGLGVEVAVSDIMKVIVTTTHIIFKTKSGSVDLFINHRFMNPTIDNLKEILGDIDIDDTRPIGKES